MREEDRDIDTMMMMLPPSNNLRSPTTGLHCPAASASTSYDSDIDTLIRLHSEKIRSGLEEMSKKHCREALSAANKLMIEKENQLEMARRRNAELEADMKRVTAAKQTWFNFAKNSEAAACGLKANLGRVLRRRTAAGDAESCCFEGSDRGRSRLGPCRACRRGDASVLVLPCRHLCLCKVCEPAADACPICHLKKDGGLRVFAE